MTLVGKSLQLFCSDENNSVGRFCITLKLTSHIILHYLCSVDLSKSFSQLIVSICILSQFFFFFFNRFCPAEKAFLNLLCQYLHGFFCKNIEIGESHAKFLSFSILRLKMFLTCSYFLAFQKPLFFQLLRKG